MRIHHLNLGSMRELESTHELAPAPAVCHALLIETPGSGLVLVESGLGADDVARPGELLDPEWVALVEPALLPAETAVTQVTALGYDPADVRHIVLTHLDVDHSGGLPDFPHARVHVMEAELEAALEEGPSRRYRPGHWAHGPSWVTYPAASGSEWYGFEGARRLDGVQPEILLIPLGGHTRGHAGVAVEQDDGWLLHAGDAYFYHRELSRTDPLPHPLLDIVQLDSQVDARLRIANRERLRELPDEVTVISAHDPWELARYR